MIVLLTILVGSALLIGYSLVEMRLNQMACAACGYSTSADMTGQICPRCEAPASPPDPQWGSSRRLLHPRASANRTVDRWPSLALIYLPLLLIAVAGTVLILEHRQADTERAIRIVRESNSRKENFTIQQYLYSTVFHRQRLGENIEIEGWRATPSLANSLPDDSASIVVEFSYRDNLGRHDAHWRANLMGDRATPLDDAARDLSWH